MANTGSAQPDAPETRARRFAALGSWNFTAIWLGSIVSNAGVQVQEIAKAWLVLQLTDSALALGLIALCYAVPVILLPPVGGLLADRADRVTILKVTGAIMVVEPLALAALLATGNAPLWVLYADTVLVAAVYAFNSPARQALVPALVPREHLLSATSLMSVVWTGTALLGPALGGLLLPLLGAAWLFALNGLTTLAVLVPLFLLRGVRGREADGATRAGRGVTAGLRFAWGHRPVLGLLGIVACVSLLDGGYQTLLPVFARDVWHAGPDAFGLMRSIPGAGALLAGVGLAALREVSGKGTLAVGALLVLCGALAGFALSPAYALGLVALFAIGLASSVCATAVQTLLQLSVPGRVRGSVMALNTVAWVGLNSLGGVLGGGLAEVLGARTAVAGSAAAVVLVTPVLARYVRGAGGGGMA
ncbi:MAG: MFS transporter [Actinomycetota bacterium]|nr:MFS transporter [Actinomycetota bacterium]